MVSDLANHCYRRYEHNLTTAVLLEMHAPADDGWIVVVRFYAALQLMNAYLVDKTHVKLRLDAMGHEHRKSAMDRCPELRDAPKKYRALKDLSERIRYDPEFDFIEHHHDESKRLLAKIVAIVEPKLKKA